MANQVLLENYGRSKSTSFFNDYAIRGVLGRGATSHVYRCKHNKDDSEWACKVVEKTHHRQRKKVIRAEIAALTKLRHPNIVEMKEVLHYPAEVCIVMELAEGGELLDRISKKGHYSEKEAARVIQQVLRALEYSHSQGIVHRDVKPENILYKTNSEDSLIKITDFGLSKDLQKHKKSFCGTIGYCAPEILKKKIYASAVDIWSLGVVLYFLLCGYKPFWDKKGKDEEMRRVVKGEYVFDSPYWDDISPAAIDFVTQLMNVDSSKRPNATDALQNPWVKGHTAQDDHLPLTQERIRKFNARRKFRAATHAIIAMNRVARTETSSSSADNED